MRLWPRGPLAFLGNALAFLPVLLSPVRSLERIPEPAEEPPPPTATVAPAPVEG